MNPLPQLGRPLRALKHSIQRWPGPGWAALLLSVAVYVACIAALHQPLHVGGRPLNFFDLRIYRGGAERVVHGIPIYGSHIIRRLGFTYPPFAAMLMTPLTLLGVRLDEALVTALNVVLLVFMLRRALLIRARDGSATAASKARDWSVAALVAAPALWLEPISTTLGYGQINLLIAGLVVFDLSRADTARSKGVAIGLAAAIKLTPLLFLPYLLLSGRRRAALIGAGMFALSILVSFICLPRDAAAYWGGLVFDSSRVGHLYDVGNQSLQGAIARLGAGAPASLAGHLVTVAVVAIGLALAVRASRRGDQAAGFSLAAVTTLLASPVSWTHHFTLAVPALLLLWRRARETRSARLRAGAAALTLLGYSYLPELLESLKPTNGLSTLATRDPYTMTVLLVLGFAAAAAAAPAAASWRPGVSVVTRRSWSALQVLRERASGLTPPHNQRKRGAPA